MAELTGLTLGEFKDRDLLYALEEAGDEDGWALAEEVGRLIGLDVPHPGRNVGSRFSWLNRYGIMDTKVESVKDLDGPTRQLVFWRLNGIGLDLLHPKSTKAVENALDGLSEAQRIKVTEELARSLPKQSRSAVHLAARAYRHHMGGWRDEKMPPGRKNGKKK